MSLTAAERKEMMALEAEQKGLSPAEAAELAQLDAEERAMRGVDQPMEPNDTLLQRIGRVLNVVPGTTRLAVKSILDQKLPTGSEYGRAITGKQPPSSQMYPGVGAVKGFGLDMLQDPTVPIAGLVGRGGTKIVNGLANAGVRALSPTAEAAADAASNPSTLRALLAAVAKKTQPQDIIQDGFTIGTKPAVNVLQTPVRQGLRAAGRALYKNSLSGLEDAAPGSTDILFDRGFKTTASGAGKNLGNEIEKMGADNAEIASRASNQGALVDAKSAMAVTRKKMQELNRAPINQPYTMRAEPWVSSTEDMGNVSLNDALFQQKTLRGWSKPAYNAGEGAPISAQIAQAGNRGFGQAIGDTLERVADPATARLYRANNVKMGTLINAEPAAQAMRSAPILSTADLAAGAGGWIFKGMPGAMAGVALRRLPQALAGPAFGTYGGRALNLLGKTPMLEQGLIQTGVRAASPWTLLDEENGHERLP